MDICVHYSVCIIDRHFLFSGVNTWYWNGWLLWWVSVYLTFHMPPNSFNHFTFLTAMDENSRRFPSSSMLMLSVFLILAILMDVEWQLIMVSICISLMANEVEHHFNCLFGTHMSRLMDHPLKSFAHFLTELFLYSLLNTDSFFYSLYKSLL